jgi:D-alanyl-D-alanine carboxypeptidase
MRKLTSSVLLFAALAAPSGLSAQSSTKSVIADLDKIFTEHLQTTKLPGLSVGVILDGRLAFSKGYGVSSLVEKSPVEPHTRFAIGSVTKQFTCACILMLAEDGKLSVYDPVAKYYPDLRRAKDIQILDLMNHTSGYPDYYPLDFVTRPMAQSIGAEALLEKYAGKSTALDFEPGTAYSYSNTGYILLGRIVEKVTGQTFAKFLSSRILVPLGMTETLYDPDPARREISKGYTTFALGPPEQNMPEGKGWVGAAGGIYSTPRDLAKWDVALLQGRVIKPASWSLMTRRRRLSNGSLTNYGCGLGVGVRVDRELLSHGGAINGFAAWNGLIPAMGAGVILFCNRDGGLTGLSNRVLDVILRAAPPASSSPTPKIAGLDTKAIVTKVFGMLQRGQVERGLFTPDFNDYLSAERLISASGRLSRYGLVRSLSVSMRRERGGMEVTRTRLQFTAGSLSVLMYRHQDGLIAQFFVRE